MEKYPKIQTIFHRDPKTNFRTLIYGRFSMVEFGYLAFNQWLFTEKIEGTNIRIIFKDGQVEFRGKSDTSQVPTFLCDKLMKMFTNESMSKVFDYDVCLYGEGYGAKIEKIGKKYIPDDVSFVLFDVKAGDWWLKQEDIVDVAQKLNIKTVPVVGQGTIFEAISIVENKLLSQMGDCEAEGLVLKPVVELHNRGNDRIITKIKYKDFLIT